MVDVSEGCDDVLGGESQVFCSIPQEGLTRGLAAAFYSASGATFRPQCRGPSVNEVRGAMCHRLTCTMAFYGLRVNGEREMGTADGVTASFKSQQPTIVTPASLIPAPYDATS